MIQPGYPVYVPSKGRAEVCTTPRFLQADGVPFFLVVEQQEVDAYAARWGSEHLLVLPFQNQGLIAARNWIRDHAEASGAARHWQLDDNIQWTDRRWKARRIRCDAGLALSACEVFTDRYTNIGVSGLNYHMFMPSHQQAPPFYLNAHVYSCSLINHAMPYRWRLRYNDDTDLCLQALAGGWCTVLVNAFLAKKTWTMQIPGGNTADLYQGDGRLMMARQLERMWPGVVETRRRFGRPQHHVKWGKFDTPLQLRPGLELADLPPVDELGMVLVQRAEIQSETLRAALAEASR